MENESSRRRPKSVIYLSRVLMEQYTSTLDYDLKVLSIVGSILLMIMACPVALQPMHFSFQQVPRDTRDKLSKCLESLK